MSRTKPGRRLVHETWGDHAALLARHEGGRDGSVGLVTPQVIDVATPNDPLVLESGERVPHVAVAFETYGELDASGRNAVLVCHALTGSAHAAGRHDAHDVPGWWDPLIGPGKAIDTRRSFVVCSNVLGGCYGTTGPTSLDAQSGHPYGPDFPRFTIRDMVTVQRRLQDALGVRSWRAVIGGSMGGMQALEWALMHPDAVKGIVAIAIGARHSAWAIGLNEVARRAIMADPAWQGGRYPLERQPEDGLGLARAIAMLSYRSYDSLEAKFGRERRPADADALSSSFEIASYLSYQGVKLVRRFDANTYIGLTRAMDEHDIAAGRGRLDEVLGRVRATALVMGIPSDVLYPEVEQRRLVEALPSARYERLVSPHGHDGFLIEYPQLAAHLRRFLTDLEG
ncbi:MAG: homoserine O-acetyltransferase [Trueperaceae bacterium]|nr:MAG: homoserine O-acetyltransferase [Trueperaceae bacterium]